MLRLQRAKKLAVYATIFALMVGYVAINQAISQPVKPQPSQVEDKDTLLIAIVTMQEGVRQIFTSDLLTEEECALWYDKAQSELDATPEVSHYTLFCVEHSPYIKVST